jgi:hypothetical protein
MSLDIQAVNLVKSKALNSRTFNKLWSEMDKAPTELLLHTEARWLSKGKRVYDLQKHSILDSQTRGLSKTYRYCFESSYALPNNL